MRISIPATSDPSGRARGSTGTRRSAEHGFTPVRRSAEHGFTLVELMVVIAILALASSALLLTSGPPDGRLSDDADRLALKIKALRDDAVVTGHPGMVWLSPSAYGFEVRQGGEWRTRDDKPFIVTNWKPGVSVSTVRGEPFAGRASIGFDTTGIPDNPATIVLSRNGSRVSVRIDGSGDVHVGR